MIVTPDLAEVTGALIGDGCLSRYFVRKESRTRHEIAFTGNADEFTYYSDFIQPVFQTRFGVKGRLFLRDQNSTRFHVLSKKAFDFFAGLGIPIGEKSHSVFIPKPFFSDQTLLLSCLRGVWDTDGSVYPRYGKRYPGHARHYSELLVLSLKSSSLELLEGVKEGLNVLSIDSNKIISSGQGFVLRVNSQKEIDKFIQTVGFRSSHHLNRLKLFKPKAI